MTEANYSPQAIVWVLKNLLVLRQGDWPDPDPLEPHSIGKKRTKGHHAYFESPAGMAAIVEAKLKQCGLDGLMVKVYFILGETDRDLADIARCKVRAIPWRIDRVLGYISGRPKTRTYLEYRDRKKGEASSDLLLRSLQDGSTTASGRN